MTRYLGLAAIGGNLNHVWSDGTSIPAFIGAAHDQELALPDYLDEANAAASLGIPLVRLRRWRREGRVAYFRLTSKTLLYARADLIALLKASRVEATVPAPAAPCGKPKSAEHRAAIAAGQAAAWQRRRAEREQVVASQQSQQREVGS